MSRSPDRTEHRVVEKVADLTCEVCGASIEMDTAANGWPTLQHAQDFLEEHSNCLDIVIDD
jgi:hypothetical protein